MTPEVLGRIIRGQDVDPMDRLIRTLDELAFIVPAVRLMGILVGLTSGSFDLGHIGHTRYTRKGWQRVNDGQPVGLMFVAVEEDDKISRRKGPNRPVIPFEERVELMASTRWADILITKKDDYPQWAVIKTICPDILLAVEETYTPAQVTELGKYCGEVYIVPRQAENSTSAQMRKIQIGGADQLIKLANPLVEASISQVIGSAFNGVDSLVDPDQLKVSLRDAFTQSFSMAYEQLGRKEG